MKFNLPKACSASSNIRIVAFSSETSAFTAMAFRPSETRDSAAALTLSALISTKATEAPSSAKRFAVAKPNPCAAPVTMPDFPSKRPIINIPFGQNNS